MVVTKSALGGTGGQTGHERARELAAIAVDFHLETAERAELDLHLQDCDPCRVHAASLAGDAAALTGLPAVDAPARVRRAITAGRSAGRWASFGPAVGALVLVLAIGVPLGAGMLFFQGLGCGFCSPGGGGVPVVTPGAAPATGAPAASGAPTLPPEPSPTASPSPAASSKPANP